MPREFSADELYGASTPSGPSRKEISASELYGPKNKYGVIDAEVLRQGGAPVAAYGVEQKVDPATARIKEKFGKAFSEESFISQPGDFLLTSRIGYNDSEEGKRKAVKSVYPNGDFKIYDMGEDGIVEMVTKDGKTWHKLSAFNTGVADVLNVENLIGALSGAGPASSITAKIFKPAAGASVGAGIDKAIRSLYDPESDDPYAAMTQSFIANSLIGGAAEGIVMPMLRRGGMVQQSPGAENALDAVEGFFYRDKEGKEIKPLEPLTKGQATDNTIIQGQYKQIQNMFQRSKKNALERFQSLGAGLKGWIDENGLDSFSKPELEALYTHAALETDKILLRLSSGKTPFGEVVGDLQNALDTFNMAAIRNKNSAYQNAFDVATLDDVELDFTKVKNVLTEIEKGVPVKTDEKDLGIADGIGVVGAGDGPPNRYLTPDAKLRRLIAKARKNANVLSRHNPDGDYVGSLEQMNAVRREFSQFAWENAENNQGRLAVQVLDAIDESIANPIAGLSEDYVKAYANAQRQYGEWRSVLQIKAISKLEAADPSTYQSYVTNLVRPGNGPILELMSNMFSGTPGAMNSVRNTFVDYLADSPSTIESTLDSLQRKDPRLLKALFPDKNDINVLRTFAKEKDRLDSSWFVKQTELDMLTEGQRALDLVSGNRDQVAKKVGDYIKYGGPNAHDAVKTALLHRFTEASTTQKAPLLGKSVIDADVFLSEVEKNRDLVKLIFSPEEINRLTHLENYALKIKDTGVGVPAIKGSVGGDTGTSLQAASVSAQVGKVPATVESRGPIEAGKKLFTTIMGPFLMAKVINLDSPIRKQGGLAVGRVREDSLQSLINYSRVATNAYLQSQERYQDASPFQDNVYGP